MNKRLQNQLTQLFIIGVLTASLYFGIGPIAAWIFLGLAAAAIGLAFAVAAWAKRNGHGGM